MDLYNSLKQYFEGKLSHSEAVKLYARHGGRKFMVSILEKEDDYAVKKLKDELRPIYEAMKQNSEQNSFKSYSPSKKAGTINIEILPDNLRKEYAKLSPLIRQISSLHAKLKEKPTDKERFNIAALIIELAAERRLIFTRCDHFMETGRDLPAFENKIEEHEPIINNWFEAQYNLKLLRSLRTKLGKNPSRHKEHLECCRKIEELEKIPKPIGE